LCIAQETRGSIVGRVPDPQDAPVPNATVVVTNTDTNVGTTLVTNETGYYEADLLIAGTYRVMAQSAGLKKSIRSGIVLSVGAKAEIDMRLEIADTFCELPVSMQDCRICILDLESRPMGGAHAAFFGMQ